MVLLNNDQKWDILKAYFEEKGLVRQHLDSFNDFIENALQEIVDEVGRVTPDIPGFYVKFGEIVVQKPVVREADGATREITPMEARIRDLTYAGQIILKMPPVPIDERSQREHEEEQLDVYIGKMPIMLKSNLCPLSKMTQAELIQAAEGAHDPGADL